MVPLTTNWVTLSVSPSTSLSLVSTLPVAVVSSAMVLLSAFACGASLTAAMLKVMVFGVVSKAPALSCTEKSKLA